MTSGVVTSAGVSPQAGVAQAPYAVGTPQFSPAPGGYGPTTSVTITTPTVGASIKYTTDGSTPSPTHGTAYTVPVSIAATTTLKAIAYNGALSNSYVATAVYTINGAVATPVITLAAGTYNNDQTSTITCATTGAAIRYTTDGTTPTAASTLYTGAVSIGASLTLKAKAFRADFSNSAVASSAYVLTVATPTFSPVAGTYAVAQSVAISSTTTGASLYYTTDGSSPTTGSTPYTVAVAVAASETLKALGAKTGYSNSTIGSAAYVITSIDPAAQAWADAVTLAGGTYTAGELAALSGFISTCKSDGNWPAVNFVFVPMMGQELAAGSIALVSGAWAAATLFNFVAGDYSPSTGWTGNGTNKYIATQAYSPVVELTANQTAVTVYNRAGSAVNQEYHMGSTTDAPHTMTISAPWFDGHGYAEAYADTVSIDAGVLSIPFGMLSSIRTSSIRWDYYQNGVSLANDTTAVSGSLPSTTPVVFQADGNFSAGPLSFAWMGPARDAAHEAAFYTAVQALQTALGRQV